MLSPRLVSRELGPWMKVAVAEQTSEPPVAHAHWSAKRGRQLTKTQPWHCRAGVPLLCLPRGDMKGVKHLISSCQHHHDKH
jgi:hypothetical protein